LTSKRFLLNNLILIFSFAVFLTFKMINSKKTTQRPPPPPFRFLLRNLRSCKNTKTAFQQVCIKRLYIKGLFDKRKTNPASEIDDTIYRPFKNNKLFKTLQNVQISSLCHSYTYESLKASKNIKKFTIETTSPETELEDITLTLKKLPPSVRSISLLVAKDDPITNQSLQQIAKSILRFPNLEHFYRSYQLDNKTDHQKELRIYNHSASRLPSLKTITLSMGTNEQSSFQKFMKKGLINPGIHGLNLYLTVTELPHNERLDQFFGADNSQDVDLSFDFDHITAGQRYACQVALDDLKTSDVFSEDSDEEEVLENSDIMSNPSSESDPSLTAHQGFAMNYIMREEMMSLYRFELFPNLKKLEISHTDCLYPLGSFIIDGFKSLKSLQDLKIDLDERSMGTTYFFKGFFQLPLLQKFSLHITFIKNEEWVLLEQFLKGQDSLESFSLHVNREPSTRIRYQKQNYYLKNIIQCFENKPLLRSIDLKSAFWSLEALSKGFARLNMVNQLHTLKLEGSDDTITSEEKPLKRVESLCNFIKNQKESLHTLQISLPFVLKKSVANHIAQAISSLTHLKELDLSINSCLAYETNHLIEYFRHTLQKKKTEGTKKKLDVSKTWNPNLAQCLQKLKNLEAFSLKFNMLHLSQNESSKWFIDIMNTLPTLKRLQRIHIKTEAGEDLLAVEEKMTNAILRLRNVKSLTIFFDDPLDNLSSSFLLLKQAIFDFNKKQSRRSDLMF